MRHYTYVASNGSQEISHYSAQIYGSLVEMSADTEGSKDPYDQRAFKFSKFSFEEQMSHICDYLWEGKFPLEGSARRTR